MAELVLLAAPAIARLVATGSLLHRDGLLRSHVLHDRRRAYQLIDGRRGGGRAESALALHGIVGGGVLNVADRSRRVVGHHFATAAQNQVSSLFMQLELNGVSKIGSNPLELLRRNIAGYYRQESQSTRPDDPFPGR